MVNMLTPDLLVKLKQKIERKYNISVNDDQISNLILSSFKCKLELECENKGNNRVYSRILLNGQVTQLRTFPLRLNFVLTDKTRPFRECIKNQLFNISTIDDYHHNIECDAFQQSSIKKTNTFSISGKQLQQLDLIESLFGDADHKYVTRNQLNSLASKIFNELNVYEEYEVPEERFSNVFVEDLIRQAADVTFINEPFKEVLANLSPYSFDEDLQPDVVMSDLSSVLEVKNYGNKSHIVVNEENYNRIMDKTRSEDGGSVGATFAGFGANVAFNTAREKQTENENSKKSLDDQLKEINSASTNHVQFEFQGKKIVPKSLRVAKLNKGKMSKNIEFKRIAMTRFESTLSRHFSLYVTNSLSGITICQSKSLPKL